jgi:hypothetical protein
MTNIKPVEIAAVDVPDVIASLRSFVAEYEAKIAQRDRERADHEQRIRKNLLSGNVVVGVFDHHVADLMKRYDGDTDRYRRYVAEWKAAIEAHGG